jgi:hypothetical protein
VSYRFVVALLAIRFVQFYEFLVVFCRFCWGSFRVISFFVFVGTVSFRFLSIRFHLSLRFDSMIGVHMPRSPCSVGHCTSLRQVVEQHGGGAPADESTPSPVYDKFYEHFMHGFSKLDPDRCGGTVIAAGPAIKQPRNFCAVAVKSKLGVMEDFPDESSDSGSDVGDADPQFRGIIQYELGKPKPPLATSGGEPTEPLLSEPRPPPQPSPPSPNPNPVEPPPIPRAPPERRQQNWGPFKLAPLVGGGWGVTCGRHTNTEQKAVCKIQLQMRGRSRFDPLLSNEECVIQLKRWCLAGIAIPQDAVDGKRQHFAIAARTVGAQSEVEDLDVEPVVP